MGRTARFQVSIPEHQLEEWEAEIEGMNTNRSKWVRDNVEAGRKQLATLDPHTEESTDDSLLNTVLEEVPDEGARPTEEIVRAVLNPVEDEVYDLIEELSKQGKINHDPKNGGYRRG